MTNIERIKIILEDADTTTEAAAVKELKLNGINAKRIRKMNNNVFAEINNIIYRVFVSWRYRSGVHESLAKVSVYEFDPSESKPEYANAVLKSLKSTQKTDKTDENVKYLKERLKIAKEGVEDCKKHILGEIYYSTLQYYKGQIKAYETAIALLEGNLDVDDNLNNKSSLYESEEKRGAA